MGEQLFEEVEGELDGWRKKPQRSSVEPEALSEPRYLGLPEVRHSDFRPVGQPNQEKRETKGDPLMPNLKRKKDVEIFERLNSLEGLPNILIDIWDKCLNDQVAENEQEGIEEALKSIETGMIRLKRILTGGGKQND